MAGRTLNIEDIVGSPEYLATQISNFYDDWQKRRLPWLKEKEELRNYIFATDTTKTTNSQLPWKNSTTLPKLCQIRDNLHANYMAALFPNSDWLTWEGDDADAQEIGKRRTIESYMTNKLRQSDFEEQVSQLVYDYIDYGNVCASTEFVNETKVDAETGETIVGYVGPKIVRISPIDIVFNPVAQDFVRTPKIIRSVKTLGDIAADIEDRPEQGYMVDVFNKITNHRQAIGTVTAEDRIKDNGYQMDGFGSIVNYYQSGFVEVLEFHGDIFDLESNVLLKNHIITVVDRKHIIRSVPNPSWRSQSVRHTGWRQRPDNLWAMGPLDNLVGMQYRIDHLENLKADVFDLIAHPLLKIRGYVEDFEYAPGERIYVGDEGDVDFMSPDTTALNADTQIAILEQKMEEMAGAPRQAMGIRTPGEKTAFEVQTLDNASSRIFQNKTKHFEMAFLENLVNDMLELARRNMQASDLIRVIDDEFGVALFTTITPEDLKARGRIRPVGARHFAANANQFQNIIQLYNSPAAQDPAVSAHISGLQTAKTFEKLLDIEEFQLVVPNIRVAEQADTQRAIDQQSGDLQKEAAVGEILDEQG